MAKKIKVRTIKKKIIVKELGKEEEQEEIIDDSLTEEEIQMILAQKARLRAMKSGSKNEIDVGLKQEMSPLERTAQEAPVRETQQERIEPAKPVKYSDSSKSHGYDLKKSYMETGGYQHVEAGTAEERMNRDRTKMDKNPFEENSAMDSYRSSMQGENEDKKKKRTIW